MANSQSADYPDAIHTDQSVIDNADSALGGTDLTHTEVHDKLEKEIIATQEKLGTGDSPASSADADQVLTADGLGGSTWQDPTGGSGSGHTIQEDGSNLTNRSKLNFSTGITATDNAGADSTDVTVTKSGIGLGNADNTSDANKPVSTAQAAADATVASNAASALASHEADTTNIHGISDTSALETTSGAQAKADAKVSDTAYGAGWNGVTTVAPSKNAVYDKIETLSGVTDGDKGDIVVSGSGATWTLDTVPVAKGGTNATTVAGAKANLGLSSVFGAYGGFRSLGHSFTQLGGNDSNVDTHVNFTHRLPAALGIAPDEAEIWGRSGGMGSSPSDGSDSDAQGVGTILRHVYPDHVYALGAEPIETSKASPALNVLMYGYNEWGRDSNTTPTSTYILPAYKHGMRTMISRLRASIFFNDDDSTIAYNGTWTTPAYTFGSKGTSHLTSTTNDYFEITIPTWFKGGTIAVCLIGNRNLFTSNTVSGSLNNTTTPLTFTVAQNIYKVALSNSTIAIGDVIQCESEKMTVTNVVTNSITVTRSAPVAHTTTKPIQLPTDTARVTWSGTATGTLKGTATTINGGTGTTTVAGQGAGGTEIQIVQRFVLSDADAGKTIRGTLTNDVGLEYMQLDSWWVEDADPPTTLCLNLNEDYGYINEGSVPVLINDTLALLCGASGEFDANVILVDLYTEFRNRNRLTLNVNGLAGTTSFTATPTNASMNILKVGSRLRLINNSIAFDEMLVTSLDKTNAGANDGKWLIGVTRNQNGTTAGAWTSGNRIYDMRYARKDDNVHPSDEGHVLITALCLDALSANALQTTRQIATSGAYANRRQQGLRNSYYLFATRGQTRTTTGGTPAKDAMNVYPFYLPRTATVVGINAEIVTGQASTTYRFSLWADGNGRPNWLIADLGANPSTGAVTADVPCYISLKPGWYWVGLTTNGGTTQPTFRSWSAGSVLAPLYNIPVVDSTAGSLPGHIRATGQSGAPTAAFPTSSVVDVDIGTAQPIIGLKLSLPITD